MRCTNRQATLHQYDECKTCNYNIAGYGVCRKGYDNYYARKNKKNGCPKIEGKKEETSDKRYS